MAPTGPNPFQGGGGTCDHAYADRQRIILDAAPRTPTEQAALNAALFERARADRPDAALRGVLINMEQGSYAVAKAQARIALLA